LSINVVVNLVSQGHVFDIWWMERMDK